jgi:hypothetical protein
MERDDEVRRLCEHAPQAAGAALFGARLSSV